MKHFYPLIMLVFLTSCTCYQPRECDPAVLVSMNIIDRDGLSETLSNPERLDQYENVDFLANQPYQKVMRVYGRDYEGNIQAYITSYHPNGQVKEYLEVFNNRAYGTYKEWHENGKLKLDTFVVGGEADISPNAEQTWLFDGHAKAWDETGNLMAEIDYCGGELHGCSTYYHTNGNIWKKVTFHKGEMEGNFEIYLKDGEILQTIEFHNGEKHGQALRYWCESKVAADEIYSQGYLMKGRYYDLDDNLLSKVDNGDGFRTLFGRESIAEEQQYKEGLLDGLVKNYDSEGVLISQHNIKNELKHGEEVEYYPPKPNNKTLTPMLAVNWYEGKIQGAVKTWYPNGMQESQREMSNNKKNGISTAWYNNGAIMLIEEYEHNKLTKGEYYQKGEKRPITTVLDGEGTATLFDGEGNFLHKVFYYGGKPMETS